jgi:hypothetical protein
MANNRLWKALGVAIFGLLLAAPVISAISNGHGRGRTQIQFTQRHGDPTASRFFAKIDVSSAISSNGNNSSTATGTGAGTGTGVATNDNDDDDDQGENGEHGNGKGKGKGKDKEHGKAKLSKSAKHGKSGNFSLAGQTVTLTIGSASFSGTADSKGRVKTPFDAKLTADGNILQIKANGLNVEELFPLDATDGKHSVTVEIKVTATPAAAGAQELTLSDQTVTFDYRVRHGRAQGRSE